MTTLKTIKATKIKTLQEVICLLEELRDRAVHQSDLWTGSISKKSAKEEAKTIAKVIKILKLRLEAEQSP